MEREQKYLNDTTSDEEGFTILTLAIVVIMVAVFAASIVGAEDIIRASKIRSVIGQVESFKTASNTFKLHYNALPGDIKNAKDFWPDDSQYPNFETWNGNGDGELAYYWWTSPGNEDLRVWQHLALAGMIPGTYTGELEPGRLLIGDVNVPPSKIIKTGYRLAYPKYKVYGKQANAIILGLTGFKFISGAIFTSQEAWQIDWKMDDGKASGGDIYSINGWQYYGSVNPESNPQAEGCVDGNIYANHVNYTYNEFQKICTIHFWLE